MDNDHRSALTSQDLKCMYRRKKQEIAARLSDFKSAGERNDKHIFAELCYCLATPGSKAAVCESLIAELQRTKLLYRGSVRELHPYFKKARFYRNKSRNVVAARRLFSRARSIHIKDTIDALDPMTARDWLVKNVRGLGFKEASHFLRNIGRGESFAILDRHILRICKRLGLIRRVPDSLTPVRYRALEAAMQRFARETGIPLAHLDLLFWYLGAGEIRK
jgi:N-glycosylase/DNA lyase